MECNNKHCLWNMYNQCCPESIELMDKAVPNTLDCPSSFRTDLEEQLYNLVDECETLLNKRNMKELIEIKKFIESQRGD